MATSPVLERMQQGLDRNLHRAVNGAKYLTGLDRPQVGRTPKDVVMRVDKAELWRYRSDPRRRDGAHYHVKYRPPVLIVHSLVSRSYILDLYPGNSFVQWLRDAGFDVFLTEWGVPDEREAGNTLETYVDDYLPKMIEATRREAGTEDVTLLGYCFGGLLSLLLSARHPELPVRNLVTMATPVDFSKMGLFTAMMGDTRLDPSRLLDDTGNVPPDTLRTSFRLLKPTGDVTTFVNLVEHLDDDQYMQGFQAMGQWTREHIPFPGAAFKQCATMLSRENALLKGTMELGGELLDLRDIHYPMLNVLAEKDHIVPQAAASPVISLVGSEQADELRLNSGHVALVAGRRAAKETIPHIADWLCAHSDPVDAAAADAGAPDTPGSVDDPTPHAAASWRS